MPYFTQEFIDFFKELAINNHKEWFHTHKKTYENHVKKPFYRFTQDLINEVKKIDKNLNLEVKNAVFRINRDIRFSKDKTPYKNHMGCVVSRGGRKDMQYPGIYVHLEPGNMMIAGGCYWPDKTSLQKLRKYIIHHPKKVEKALNDEVFMSMYGSLSEGEKNKILPKEFKSFGDDYPLLFNKQFYFHKTYRDENLILQEDLLLFVMTHYHAGESWNNIIKEALYGEA